MNCVISAVGKNSLHKEWINGTCDFDLHLIVYDNSLKDFKGDSNYISNGNGYKLRLVYQYLQRNPSFMDEYEYFFIPDDDIFMSALDINNLFKAMKKYDLKIAQPALISSYFSWPHTLKDNCCKLRYTNMIEMMVPCFSREALKKVILTFDANSTGWGIEAHWPILLNSTNYDIAVIDEINVIHTRPIQSGQPIHFREQKEYQGKYNINNKATEYGFILRDDFETIFLRDSYHKTTQAIIDWLKATDITTSKLGLDGCLGYVLLLQNLFQITHAKKYADLANRLLSRVYQYIGTLKHDMNVRTGITGCVCVVCNFLERGLISGSLHEVLNEFNDFIIAFFNKHQHNLSLSEVLGIGIYASCLPKGIVKHPNSSDVQTAIIRELAGKMSIETNGTLLDVLFVLKSLDLSCEKFLPFVERKICSTIPSVIADIYNLFRFYLISDDEYYWIKAKEGLKNMHHTLMTLEDALMLSEMLLYNRLNK